ncbi:MAG: Fic family protein [Parcubacteria group bacterium]|jgi:Fic family protein
MKKRIGETSHKQTAFGIIPRSKLIPLEIEGIKRAWDFVLQKSDKSKMLITPDLIKKLHEVGFAWIFPDTGGKFRKIDVRVSKHDPPKFFLVSQLISDFTEDLKIRTKHLPKIENKDFFEELISLLSWAHHRFLWIHPFQDYNGRIGRLLINIILLNLDLPPIELKVETKAGRKKYIEALQSADDGDYRKLEKIIRSALEEATEEVK